MSSRPPDPTRAPRCPTCGVAIVWNGNPQRPFCSLSCRLIDLGKWLDERYRVEGPPIPTDTDQEDAVAKGSG